MALRAAQIRRVRVPVRTLTLTGRTSEQPLLGSGSLFRSMSLHGHDHTAEDKFIERVLSVVESFPTVDTSKVSPDVHFLKDLGLDSLDNVERVIALEEEFKLRIPEPKNPAKPPLPPPRFPFRRNYDVGQLPMSIYAHLLYKHSPSTLPHV